MKKVNLSDETLEAELKRRGYLVKKKENNVRKTFELPEELVQEFMNEVRARGMKVKDAIRWSLESFLKSKR